MQTPRKWLVDFIVCVIGDCAKNHVSVFGTQAEMDAHMNEVHGDTSFSMLTMNALYGTNIPGAGAKGKRSKSGYNQDKAGRTESSAFQYFYYLFFLWTFVFSSATFFLFLIK